MYNFNAFQKFKNKSFYKAIKKLGNESFYWTIGLYSLGIAGITHVLFLLLFIYLQITPLIIANIFSVASYYYSAFILGPKTLDARNDSVIGWIVYCELIVHAIIATICLGTTCGFQYYVYILAFLPFFNSTYSKRTRAVRFLLVILVSIFLKVLSYNHSPYYPLDDLLIFSFQLMNLVFFLGILGGISFFYFQENERYQEILLDESWKDPLTKLFNRRFIVQKMEGMFPCSPKNGIMAAIILLDIDFFKKINDRYGHNAGDSVLISLAQVLQKNIRSDNIVSRWGGEEFLITCSVADKSNLMKIMERLRNAVKAMSIHNDNQDIAITITLGGAILLPGESFSEAVNRADQALYIGKKNGRDQGVIAK
jgi:diguanylate cyclase (GGDEF)-like protein